MNKDILVLLLQKDIKELGLLTEGFEKMSEFPDALLRLAKDKAENVVKILDDLAQSAPQLELGDIDYQSFDEKYDENEAEEKTEIALDNDLEEGMDGDNEQPIEATSEESIEPISQAEENESLHTDTVEEEPELESKEAEEEEWGVERVAAGIEAENEPIAENKEEAVVEIKPVPQVNEVPKKEKMKLEEPHTAVLNDTLSHEDNSVSSNLANQKIDDIRLAINIGDRFRFQRELFGGNGETLNKTITYLNQLAKFEEAETFLKSKFNWDDDDAHAEDFLQIVRRRYL